MLDHLLTELGGGWQTLLAVDGPLHGLQHDAPSHELQAIIELFSTAQRLLDNLAKTPGQIILVAGVLPLNVPDAVIPRREFGHHFDDPFPNLANPFVVEKASLHPSQEDSQGTYVDTDGMATKREGFNKARRTPHERVKHRVAGFGEKLDRGAWEERRKPGRVAVEVVGQTGDDT